MQNAAERASHKRKHQDEHVRIGIETISSYVEKSVIIDKRPELLSSVYSRYCDICVDSEEIPVQTAQYLMKMLLNIFGSSVKVQSPRGKKLGVILYGSDSADEAVRIAYDFSSTPEGTVTKAALLLRQLVKKIPDTEFPDQPTVQDLQRNAPSPPELLSTFFSLWFIT